MPGSQLGYVPESLDGWILVLQQAFVPRNRVIPEFELHGFEYCLGGPAILNDKKYKWSCEDCVPRKTDPSLPCKKSERLRPTVERLTGRKNAWIKWRKKLWASQVENPIGVLKETAKEATYPAILDQKIGSAKAEREKITQQSEDSVDRNKLNTKELHINNNNSSRLIVHGLMGNHKKSVVASEKTEREKMTQQSEDRVDRNKLNANELRISDNNSSQPIVQGLMANHKKSVVEDFVHEQQGDVEHQAPWKKTRLADVGKDCSSKSSSEALPKLIDVNTLPQLIPVEMIPQVENPSGALKETTKEATYPSILDQKNKVGSEKTQREKITKQSEDCVDRNKLNANELYINNNNSSRRTVHGLTANHKKSVVEDFVHEQQGDVEHQAPWKKTRLVDVGKDCSSKSSSEANPKLIDVNSLPLFTPVEMIPNRPSPTKVDDRREPTIAQMSSLMKVNQIPTQPLMDSLWRGNCDIRDNERVVSLVLEAHLSNTGDGKVQGAVLAMPVSLNFDLVPKRTAWPMSFKEQPPTGGDISLYLFPCDERNEKLYNHVIDKMIGHGLVLTSYINNLQLLVFCSRELPREEWTFRRKYYIWGVFKQRKDLIMLNKPTNICTKKVESPIPAKYPSENIYPQKEPCTASPNVNQVKRLPEELTRTVSSKSFKRPRDKKGEFPIPAKSPSENIYPRKEPNTASPNVYQVKRLPEELTQTVSSKSFKRPRDKKVEFRIPAKCPSENIYPWKEPNTAIPNVHQYKRLPEELTRTVSSKSFKRPRDKKAYTNNYQKRDTDFGGSYRNDYNQNYRTFSKSQDRGRDHDSGFFNNPPRRHYGEELGKCGSTWKDQGSRGARYSPKPK